MTESSTPHHSTRFATVAHRLVIRAGAGLRQQWGSLVLLIGLLGGIGLMIWHFTPALPLSTRSADQAETFMRALRDHDAAALWGAMNDDLRSGLVTRMGLPAGEQAEFARTRLMAERSSVTSYKEIAYQPLRQGGAVHLFLATARDPSGAEVEVPFTLTVGQDGLVATVE